MIIIMNLFTSHDKYHGKRYSDILYRINSINFMRCCTSEDSTTQITSLLSRSLSILMFSYGYFSIYNRSLLTKPFHFMFQLRLESESKCPFIKAQLRQSQTSRWVNNTDENILSNNWQVSVTLTFIINFKLIHDFSRVL